MNLKSTLTTILLGLGLTLGSQTILPTSADANPLAGAMKGGKRTHKKSSKSSQKNKSDSDKKKSSSSSRSSSSSDGRVVRRTTTTRSPSRSTTHNTGRRTTTYRRPASSSRSVSRSTHRPSSSTHHRHASSNRTVRTSSGRRLRGNTSRRTTYHRSSRRHTSHRHHSHSHTTVVHSSGQSSRSRGSASARGETRGVEAYVTGGLGFSGFASNQITDLPLPGAGYDLAVGAKGSVFGGELGLNGGGWTFDPSEATADIAMVGLSADLKLQPSFGFFEPYVSAGLGGYALNDAVIDESATGLGLRLGVGADFRVEQFALRVKYQHAAYGLNDINGQYGGDLSAQTATLGANLVVYF